MPKSLPSRRRALAAVPLAAAALALPASAGAAGVALSTAGWSWTNPAPQGNSLTGIEFLGNTGYAYGGGGTILRTGDGGSTWAGLYTGTGQSIDSIDLVGENTLVARVGTEKACGLRISTDGGATFTRSVFDGTEADCAVGIRSADFVTATTGYLLMDDGRVFRTTDGGASFGSATKVEGGTRVLFGSETTGFATTATTLRRTPDGGQTWADVAPLPSGVTSVRLLTPTTLIGWGKGVYGVSTDAGVTWTTQSLGSLDPTSVSCRTAQQCAFFGDNQLALTSDGAQTLTKATIGNGDVYAVGYAAGARLVAIGRRGVTYLSDDDGATFRRTSSDPVAEEITSIDTRGTGGPVGITSNGRIARVAGEAWTLLPTLTTGALADADFVDDKLGFALGANGTLQRTQNGGATWTTLDTGTPSASQWVVAFDASTQALLGRFGVYRAGADGIFEKVGSKALRSFSIKGVDAKGKRAFVWDPRRKTGGIRATADGGRTWRVVTLPKGARSVGEVAAIPGKGLLATIDDRLYRSTSDRGAWKELPGAGAQIRRLEAASTTEFLVVPRAGEWDDSVILRSTDRGATFAAQSLTGGGTAVGALAADGPGRAYAAVTGGEAPALFSTTTGGVRGAASTLSLSRTARRQKPSAQVAVSGSLAGARGGEEVRVAVRRVGSGSWTWQRVVAGANGGSFTARFRLTKGRYEVVGQWTGDSGRAGTGSRPFALTVHK